MNHLLATITAVSFVLAACEAFEERPYETVGFFAGTAAGAVIGYDIGGAMGASTGSAAGLLAADIGEELDEDGRVKAQPSRLPSTSLAEQPDRWTCSMAITNMDGTPRWEDRGVVLRNNVDEAKRRGFTPEGCAKLLGWKSAGFAEVPAEEPEKMSPEKGNIEKRLRTLKNLYDKGLITREEYERKQGEVLEVL